MKDVTVIGAGPVGLSAAFWAGMREASVQIVDALPEIGGQLTALYPDKPIYDVPGHPVLLARELVELHRRQTLEQFDVPLHLSTTAVGLRDEGEHLVLETDRGDLETRTLIVAAGHGRIEPRTLPELNGVSYLPPSLPSLAGKRVVVVGGGDSACDWALLLQDVAAEVHLVHRRERFRALEKTVRELHESRVALHVPATIARRTDEGVELSDGTFVACDAVVPQLGFKSALGPVAEWMTRPRVWACGDVASYDGKLKLIATGYAEAASAVAQAVKLVRPEMPLQPGYSTDTGVPAR